MRYLLPAARPIVEDLAGTLAFYLIYLATQQAGLAAAVGLVIGLCQISLYRWRRQVVPVLLVTGVALTMLLGSLTIYLHDPRFILLKPTIIYVAIGSTMLPRGWVLRYVPDIARRLLPAATLDRVGWSWAALLIATGVANLVLVAVLPPLIAATWLAIGAATSKLLLFGVQYTVLRAKAKRAYLSGGAASS